MALTKGIGFINVRAFVNERYGAPAWRALLESFPRPDRMALESVVSIGWYDLGLYARLIRAVDARHGAANLKLCYTLGRFEAERDLTTVHQWFLKLFRPSVAIEQMDKYWRRFHDTGEWATERRGDREVISRLTGWGVVDAALCRELLGYLGRTLELLGGRDITLEHTRCRVRSDPHCEFHLIWRTPKEAVEAGSSGELPPWMPPPTGQSQNTKSDRGPTTGGSKTERPPAGPTTGGSKNDK